MNKTKKRPPKTFYAQLLLDLEHFKVLGNLVVCLFTVYSYFMICFIFICISYTDPFKIPSMIVTWEILPKSQANQKNYEDNEKFKLVLESIHVYNTFWLSLTSLNLLEERDTFQMIQKNIQQIAETFCRKKVWKVSRHSGKFPHNLDTFKTMWELSRQYGKCT